jgi:hypothetical protein
MNILWHPSYHIQHCMLNRLDFVGERILWSLHAHLRPLCSKGQSKVRCVLVTLLYWCELLNVIIIITYWWSFLTSKFDNSDWLLSVVRVNLIVCSWIFSAFNVIFEWEYWNSSFPAEVIERFHDIYWILLVLYGSYLGLTKFFFIVVLCILIILKFFSPTNAFFIKHTKC